MPHNYDYDYFVIGAGSGGVRSARIAGTHGAKVGIAEAGALGGTCVNVGCVPKKLMAYASDYHAHFKDSQGFGWSHNDVQFDWPTLIKNKNAEIERLNGIYKKLLDGAGVTLHNGFASFVDPHTLQIGDETVTADKILIATGGKPRRPDIPGGEHMIVSDDAFYLDHLPKDIVIYGGGYIAVEFAHIFHGLGSNVTLIYRGDIFLRGFDKDIREHLMAEMEKQGINLIFNTEITSSSMLSSFGLTKGSHSVEKNPAIKSQDDSLLEIQLSNNQKLTTNLAMAAIGREANTDRLNLEAAGLEANRNGVIDVNDQYQTAVDHIYALGDVIGRIALTPVAIREGHWLADTLFGDIDRPTPSYENIPTAVFSRPNIGTVGLTEDQAKEKGHDVTIFKSNFKPMVHTLSGRDERTLMKLVVDKATDKVLGLHMVGLDVAEILQGFGVAIKAGLTKAQFDETIGIHPTSAEELVTMR